MRTRNYAKEYADYHAKPEQIKRRSQRNKARRKMEKLGRVRKGDGKDVHHVNGMSNRRSNLRAIPRSLNRSIQ